MLPSHVCRLLLAAAFLSLPPLVRAEAAAAPLPLSTLPHGAVARLGAVRFIHHGTAYDMAISADGKLLATVGSDQVMHLWDLATGKRIRTYTSQREMLTCVAFAPDGKLIATGGVSGTVELWEVVGDKSHSLKGHEQQVSVVAFSGDGKTLVSGSFDETVRLWDVAEQKERHVLKGHAGNIWGVAITHDGKTAASAGRDGTARVWDVKTGREKAVLRGHSGEVHMVAFSPDDKTLASSSQDRTVVLWDLATHKAQKRLEGTRGRLASVTFSPDGKLVAAGCECGGGRIDERVGEVYLWEAASGKRLGVLKGHWRFANSVVFSPDSRTLASAGVDGTIRLWDVASLTERCRVPGHDQGVSGLAWSADGQTLVSGSEDQTVRLWDIKPGLAAARPRATLPGHSYAIQAVAAAPNGQTIATADLEGQIRIWDADTGRLRYFVHRYSGSIMGLDFSPDGKTLAASSSGTPLRLWDIPAAAPHSGKERITFKAGAMGIGPAVFSPDGKKLVAAASESAIRVWDIATEESQVIPKQAEEGQQPGVGIFIINGRVRQSSFPVAFAPNGRIVAQGRTDGSIGVFDLTTRTERRVLSKHEDAVRHLAISADGKMLISAGGDGTVKLWEMTTGKERATLTGHAGGVTALALHSDGRTLASGSEDTSILLWDLFAAPEGRKVDAEPTAEEGRLLWNDLSGTDSVRAYQAICLLVHRPRFAVALLKERLASIKGPDTTGIERLIAGLDSEKFNERERSSRELDKLGALAEPALRKALESGPPPEMRRRIKALLDKLNGGEASAEQRQAARVTEVLEKLATPEARGLLRQLADGSSGPWYAGEAKLVLERLDRRAARRAPRR